MHYESFVGTVARRAAIAPERARTCVRATLETLAERLTAGEAMDLAAQLPKPLRDLLRPRGENAQRFGAGEFVRRAGERCGPDGAQAKNEAQTKNEVRAVFATMREAICTGEFDDVLAQLPDDFADVIPDGQRAPGRARVRRR